MLEKESVEGVATMGRVVGTPSPFIAAQVRRLYVSRLSYFHGSSRQRILLDTVMDKFDEATQVCSLALLSSRLKLTPL